MSERKLGVVTVIEHPEDSDCFVLVEETKARKKGRLNLAGGEVDGPDENGRQENILEAAIREAGEEANLEIELTGFLGLFDYEQDGKLQIALAGVAVGGEMRSSPKHPTVESYPFHVIEKHLMPEGQLRSDRVFQAISQYREGLILPVDAALHIASSDVLPSPAVPVS